MLKMIRVWPRRPWDPAPTPRLFARRGLPKLSLRQLGKIVSLKQAMADGRDGRDRTGRSRVGDIGGGVTLRPSL